MVKQYVYAFGGGKADGRADMKELLGGKGANLAEMSKLGVPVPPGFTISTEVCTHFMKNDGEQIKLFAMPFLYGKFMIFEIEYDQVCLVHWLETPMEL